MSAAANRSSVRESPLLPEPHDESVSSDAAIRGDAVREVPLRSPPAASR
jgi:hypothetical protein